MDILGTPTIKWTITSQDQLKMILSDSSCSNSMIVSCRRPRTIVSSLKSLLKFRKAIKEVSITQSPTAAEILEVNTNLTSHRFSHNSRQKFRISQKKIGKSINSTRLWHNWRNKMEKTFTSMKLLRIPRSVLKAAKSLQK